MQHKLCNATISSLGDRKMMFVISTAARDRDGDTIDQNGWDLSSYKENSVVLWAHDTKQPPVAKATRLWTDHRGLNAEIEWPPEGVYPFADQLHGLVKNGFLNATSVGFRPIETRPTKTGHHISKAELLEFSLVSLPSNQEALVLQRAYAPCDQSALTKWLGDQDEIDWDSINRERGDRIEVDVSREDVQRVVDTVVPRLVAAGLSLVATHAAHAAINRLTGRLD